MAKEARRTSKRNLKWTLKEPVKLEIGVANRMRVFQVKPSLVAQCGKYAGLSYMKGVGKGSKVQWIRSK